MRATCSVFIATSLDGFISRPDGSIDWLMQANARVPEGEDCGYAAFMKTVDAVVMGRKTFGLYVDGGKTIQGFLAAGLVDDITITVIPLLLGSGLSLFGPLQQDIHLTLESSRAYAFGFVQNTYVVHRERKESFDRATPSSNRPARP
jgi:dihydrofolate reductase